MDWPDLSSSQTDRIFIDTLSFNATAGRDCWGRTRPQPLSLTIEVEANLQKAAHNDDLTDSINYGGLAKQLLALCDDQQFESMLHLAQRAAELVVTQPGAIGQAKVELRAQKGLLQDAGLGLQVRRGKEGKSTQEWTWLIDGWRVPVLIGMNPPERQNKQILIIDLKLLMRTAGTKSEDEISIPELMQHLSVWVDTTSFLTLERFTRDLIHEAMHHHSSIAFANAKVSKPCAVAGARFTAIQMQLGRKQGDD